MALDIPRLDSGILGEARSSPGVPLHSLHAGSGLWDRDRGFVACIIRLVLAGRMVLVL